MFIKEDFRTILYLAKIAFQLLCTDDKNTYHAELTYSFVDSQGIVVLFCCYNLAYINESIHDKVSFDCCITHYVFASDVTFSLNRLRFTANFSPFHFRSYVTIIRHTTK